MPISRVRRLTELKTTASRPKATSATASIANPPNNAARKRGSARKPWRLSARFPDCRPRARPDRHRESRREARLRAARRHRRRAAAAARCTVGRSAAAATSATGTPGRSDCRGLGRWHHRRRARMRDVRVPRRSVNWKLSPTGFRSGRAPPPEAGADDDWPLDCASLRKVPRREAGPGQQRDSHQFEVSRTYVADRDPHLSHPLGASVRFERAERQEV